MLHHGVAPRIVHGARTDPGRLRSSNEDALVAEGPVFVVADGVGGHRGGARAAGIVIEELGDLTARTEVTQDELSARLACAQRRIEHLNANARGRSRAATTVSGLAVSQAAGLPYWLVLNLGDSRSYRLARGRLTQLTQDHSEVQELLKAGALTRAQARTYPRRHVVSRALGAAGRFRPDYRLEPMTRGERMLVCTDGLTAELADRQIAAILTMEADPRVAADRLVAEALNAGGRDNISAIVVDVADVPEPYVEDDATHIATGPGA